MLILDHGLQSQAEQPRSNVLHLRIRQVVLVTSDLANSSSKLPRVQRSLAPIQSIEGTKRFAAEPHLLPAGSAPIRGHVRSRPWPTMPRLLDPGRGVSHTQPPISRPMRRCCTLLCPTEPISPTGWQLVVFSSPSAASFRQPIHLEIAPHRV